MKIGVDARYLGLTNTGLAKYSDALLHAISRDDEVNEYVVFVSDKLKRKLKLGENFEIVPLRGNPLTMSGLRRLRRAVRRTNVDLLHVHFPMIPIGLGPCKTLITVHDLLPFIRDPKQDSWRRPRRWLWSFLYYPYAIRKATWIVCVSNATRNELVKLFPDALHKSIVVHSGVVENFGKPVEPATLELLYKKLNLPPRYVLYSGSMREDKNIEGMLNVFARMRQNNAMLRDVSLIIETNAAYPQHRAVKLIHQYELDNNVRIITDMGQDERKVIFQNAMALLLLGRNEGFGFPVLEAQLCGIPVLVADAGALPEVAGENGAVIVDPDNSEECAKLLTRLLSDVDLRAYLVDEGAKNASRFNWQYTAVRMIEIYDLLFYPRNTIDYPNERRPLEQVLEWIQR